jgi:hypothetical protein
MTHLHISLKRGSDSFICEYKIGVKNVQNSHLTTARKVL